MKMIQLRNVPDSLHRKLKIRAARKDMSLSDYLLSEIKEVIDTPTLEELVDRISESRPHHFDSAAIIREIRDGTDRR